jgi:hypothetical protein
MQIFENFIDRPTADKIEEGILSIPWYFQSSTADYSTLGKGDGSFQRDLPYMKETLFFVNLVGCESHGTTTQDAKHFVPIIKKLEEVTGRSFFDRIIRIKADLYVQCADYPEDHYHQPHIDMWNEVTHKPDDAEIFLYYADDSDGDTFFFKEAFGADKYTTTHRSKPVKGKGVLFSNDIVHSSSPPVNHVRRMTVNFVFSK